MLTRRKKINTSGKIQENNDRKGIFNYDYFWLVFGFAKWMREKMYAIYLHYLFL